MLLILLGPLLALAAEVANPGMSSSDQDLAHSSPFMSDAARCGTTCQANNTPDKHGGASMCGRAVSEMVQCMSRESKYANGCTGKCGNGKDFVDCSNGQMEKCGYEKVSNASTDKRCTMPGAVLAYTKTPTDAGQKYGHVEMVCGVDRYCSMYKREHNQPWPRPVPDACWAPKSTEFDKMLAKSKGSSDGNVGSASSGSGGNEGASGDSRVPSPQLLLPLMRRNQQPTGNVQRAIQQRGSNANGTVRSVVDPSP